MALASACAVVLAITGVLAKLSPVAVDGDRAGSYGFTGLNRPRLTPLLDHVAHLADPAPYALAAVLLALVALIRGRWRVALVIPVLFVATGATTEALKRLLGTSQAHEWFGTGAHLGASGWPSGHSTAAMTMALCAVIAVPPRVRPTAAALGGAFAIAVAYAILTLGWHFPSDVLGGYLVSATWVLVAVSLLAALESRWPSRVRAEAPPRTADLLPALGVAVVVGLAAAAVVLSRPQRLVDYAQAHTTFVLGAAAIAALAVALAALMLASVRGPRSPVR
jgi:membrane-associated phospholipid phosphatase